MNLKNAVLGVLVACGLAAPAATQTTTSVPSFSISDATAVEGSGRVTLTVKKHGTLNNSPSTITVKTAARTALANSDYVPVSITLNFAASELTKTVTITLNNDTVAEPTETFAVLLYAGTNSRLYDGTGVVTVTDDDGAAPPAPTAPQLSIGDVTVNEGAGTVRVTVTRTGDLTYSSRFSYASSDGTAKAGSDYTARSGTMTIPAGNRTLSWSMALTNDTVYEPTEQFKVTIAPMNNANIVKSVSVVTITDNDTAPTPTPVKPVMLTAPQLSGNALAGSVLTISSQGTWSGAPTNFFYNWEKNAVAITGASAPTYTTTLADAGAKIRGSVVACNSVGCAQAYTNEITVTAPVVTPPPTKTCPDGSVIPSTSTCPTSPPPTTVSTQKCADGAVVRGGSVCPAIRQWVAAPLTVGGFFCNSAQENTPNIGPCGTSIVYRITGFNGSTYTAVFFQDASGQFPANDVYNSNVTGVWSASQMKGIAPAAVLPTVSAPTVLMNHLNQAMNVQQCPDEGMVYVGELCATLFQTALPVPPNGQWTLAPVDPIFKGIKASGYALATQTCPSVYTSPAYTLIKNSGVQAGVVYRVISWSYGAGTGTGTDHQWVLENPSGAHAITVSQTCLTAVQ